MRYLDENPSVLSWGSETVVIRYRDPVTNRVRSYYPDFKVTLRNKKGKIETLIVEVKPARETKPPTRKSKYYESYMKTYATNQAKWRAAKVVCENREWDFRVLTEKELGIG